MSLIFNSIENLKPFCNKNNCSWIIHSIVVASIAKFITENYKVYNTNTDINSNIAFICGLFHDIGRIEKDSHMHHIIRGYNMLASQNPLAAKICLTHSFPTKNVEHYQGVNNCSELEITFLRKYITNCNYTYYDKLIQLCDALGSNNGVCKIEYRLNDVITRVGKKHFTPIVHKKYYRLKNEFDNLLKMDIYDLIFLPEVEDFIKNILKNINYTYYYTYINNTLNKM